jgi:poly-gamma-glutamate capsule biosynthesis protein CapA/YwtB (metallophosphatase superfamily)
MLKKYHFNVLNLGNNHIGNFGVQGALSTQRYLTEGGISYFGDIGIAENRQRMYQTTVNGVAVGFVNYNEFVDQT